MPHPTPVSSPTHQPAAGNVLMTPSSSMQKNDPSDSMQGMWMEMPSYIWELVPVTTRKPQYVQLLMTIYSMHEIATWQPHTLGNWSWRNWTDYRPSFDLHSTDILLKRFHEQWEHLNTISDVLIQVIQSWHSDLFDIETTTMILLQSRCHWLESRCSEEGRSRRWAEYHPAVPSLRDLIPPLPTALPKYQAKPNVNNTTTVY